MIFRRSKTEARRSSKLVYKKQRAYHYSAKRSRTDHFFDRKEAGEESTEKKSLRTRFYSLSLVAFPIVITASLLYLANLSTSAAIEVVSSQYFLGDKASIQSKSDTLLKSSILNRSKLTFNEEKLAAELRSSFPEIAEVSVKTHPIKSRPHITVRFSKPTVLLTNGTNVYILGEDGKVLMDATKDKPTFDTSDIPLVQDQTEGTLIEVGKAALTTSQIRYIDEVKRQSEQVGLKVATMIMTSGGGELHVRYGGLSYFVKYNFFENPGKSSGTFFAIKERLDKENNRPAEYVDVRIPERAYIK